MIIFLLIEVTLHLENGMATDIMQALRAIVLFPTDNANMPIASAMWFLPCLFMVSVIYSFLDIFKFGTKALIVLLISVCGAIYPHFFDYMLPLALEPAAAALFFMLTGEYIKKNCPYETFLSKKPCIVGLFLIEAALAFVNGSVDLRSARFHIAPLYFINGILGTIVYFGIAKCIAAFQSKLGRVLKNELIDLGEYSIVILCTHQLFIQIMNRCLGNIPTGALYVLCSKSIIFVVTMLLCRLIIQGCKSYKPIRHMFGIS